MRCRAGISMSYRCRIRYQLVCVLTDSVQLIIIEMRHSQRDFRSSFSLFTLQRIFNLDACPGIGPPSMTLEIVVLPTNF